MNLSSKVATFISIALVASTLSAQSVNIPPDYKLIKGTGFSQKNQHAIDINVDNIDNPTKGYVSVANGFCLVSKKEVTIKKTLTGFTFFTDIGDRCKESNLSLIGPDGDGWYTGTWQGLAGTSSLNMRIIK